MVGLWATKNEGVRLIVRAISFQDFQPVYSYQRYRRTDRRYAIATPRFACIARYCCSFTPSNIRLILFRITYDYDDGFRCFIVATVATCVRSLDIVVAESG